MSGQVKLSPDLEDTMNKAKKTICKILVFILDRFPSDMLDELNFQIGATLVARDLGRDKSTFKEAIVVTEEVQND